MKERVRQWFAETHGTRFELLRHFVPRLFDSDIAPSSADLTRIASGVLAVLSSGWMLLAAVLLLKYRKLAEMNLLDRVPAEVRSDLSSITAMAVCLTILLVAVLWQSLYPTLRDYLALAGFPVSSADIFFAKFSALLLAFGVFAVLLILPVAAVFALTTGASFGTSFLLMTAACTLAFFGLMALQGTLLNILPAGIFERVMLWTQALLAAASLGGFSFMAWKGAAIPIPSHSAWHPLLAIILAPVVAAVTYVLSFHRFAKLLLEAPPHVAGTRRDVLRWLLDFIVRDPREQAALAFMWKTMQRSRIHRLAVLIYCGLAAAWVLKSLVDLNAVSATAHELERTIFTAGPLALILLTLFGLRHLFCLPADLRARWIFQVAEREGRRAWLDAVERFVLGFAIAPVIATGAVFVGQLGGFLTAIAWAGIAFFLAAIGFEYLFRDWRKLPFTCSYLPGKRPFVLNCVLFFGLMPLLVPVAWIVYQCATNPASLLVMLLLEAGVWTYLRRTRLLKWGLTPLLFEEQPQTDIDSFGFSQDGTTLAQEQFQREWTDYLRGGQDEPILRPLDAGETRSARVWEWLTALPRDLRYALRLVMKKPGFAITIVLTLGLGLGLNAAFFTIFNAFLLRPLAVRDPASLVSVNFETNRGATIHLSWQEYQLFAAKESELLEISASSMEGTGLEGQSARAAVVSGNFFTLLGVGTVLGRPFQAGEQEPVLVLAHRVWQNRFGGDPRIIGRRLLVGGVPFEVIGIAPPEFAGVNVGTIAVAPKEAARFGLAAADFWAPVEVWNRMPSLPQFPVYGIIGRIPAGVSFAQAQAMATSLLRQIATSPQGNRRGLRATLDSLDIPITWTTLSFSFPLLLAFGLTMLIPCANAANMMLARALSRQRELGTRLSLGATRGRVVRQLLTESLLLAILAGAAGLAISRVALNTFSQLLFSTAPPTLLFRFRMPELLIDAHVFVYMLVVAGFTTILFALAPAAHATRVALLSSLRGEFGEFRSFRLRDALVVGQVAVCVMLLVTASVLLRGTGRAEQINRGYEPRGVYGVANQNPEDATVLARMLAPEPWVDSMAIMGRPLIELDSIPISNASRPNWQDAYYQQCSGDYFHLMRIPILRGRTFTRDEAETRAAVAVVSEMTARRLWPGENPIGRTIALQTGLRNPQRAPGFHEATVIGVNRDFVVRARDGGPRPTVHFPGAIRWGSAVVVRGKGSPDQTARGLEAVLARAPGSAHGARVVALQETIDWETYPQQAASWLSTLLGLVALLLTITGIYGVMSYLVSQRTKEIGIRMALGATRTHVARFIFGYSAQLAALGLAAGVILALGVLQYSASQIELLIDLHDAAAYSLSVVVVAVAVVFAATGPTRRACSVEPQEALRSD